VNIRRPEAGEGVGDPWQAARLLSADSLTSHEALQHPQRRQQRTPFPHNSALHNIPRGDSIRTPSSRYRHSIDVTATKGEAQRPRCRVAHRARRRRQHGKGDVSPLLNLRTELRLQVYGEVVGDVDPAFKLQPLLRVFKLVEKEVTNESPALNAK
jgi:hypothetical protein